jgi:hypothetical protein
MTQLQGMARQDCAFVFSTCFSICEAVAVLESESEWANRYMQDHICFGASQLFAISLICIIHTATTSGATLDFGTIVEGHGSPVSGLMPQHRISNSFNVPPMISTVGDVSVILPAFWAAGRRRKKEERGDFGGGW